MRFKLDLDGSAWLDGLKLKDILSVDVQNINPCDKMELTICLSVEEIDISYNQLRDKGC